MKKKKAMDMSWSMMGWMILAIVILIVIISILMKSAGPASGVIDKLTNN